MNKVKPVDNISKNIQILLLISPEQKEVLPSHKTMHFSNRILLNLRKIILHRGIARIK